MNGFRRFCPNPALVFSVLLLTGCSTLGGQTPNNYIIFFADGTTALSPEARAIVDQAAAAIRTKKPSMVAVSTGVAGSNLQLAAPRFEAIQKALVADGVPTDIIARATLPDPRENVTPVANQRAEIFLFLK
jgi:hypothetical protein